MCPSVEYNVDEKITSFAFVWIVNRAETTYKVSKFPYYCLIEEYIPLWRNFNVLVLLIGNSSWICVLF